MKKKYCSPHEDMDIISNLPEPIRNHIISFLPMEDAIRTSILSKQWRKVSSTLPNLDFDQRHFEKTPSKEIDFKDFVYQTLDLRRDDIDIQKFRLSVDEESPHLNSWISFAVQHNVREFYLYVAGLGILETLPCCLFTCTSLTALYLSNMDLNLPTIVRFPMLKSLGLSDVKFSDDNQTNKLITSCPLLEDLEFLHCSWARSNTLVISAPNLMTLKLLYSPRSQEVKISSTNLRDIQYFGNAPDISFETLSSLTSARFFCFLSSTTTSEISRDVLDHRVSKIFMGLQNVVKLTLDEFSIETLSKDRDFSPHQLQICCCLKDLRLNMFATKNQVKFVTFLLGSYLNMQTLSIFLNERDPSRYMLNTEGYWQSQELSAEGTLKQLKTVNVHCFKGSDNELYLVKHLLSNATVMEKMDINFSKELDEDEASRMSISEKLAQIAKVSFYAKILFS